MYLAIKGMWCQLQMLDRSGTKWLWPVPKKLSNLSHEDSNEIHEKHWPEQPVPNVNVPVVV